MFMKRATHRLSLLDPVLKLVALSGLLVFGVNSLQGQDALSIDDKGNVGIGTTKPAAKFQVKTGAYDFLTNQFTVDVGLDGATGPWRRAFRIVNSSGSDGKDGGAFGVSGDAKAPGYAYISIPTKDATGYDSTKILVLDNAGRVGLGTSTPPFPLSFPNQLGDKIGLYGNAGAHYGFGIQAKLLQIHTDVAASDIAFGYGRSDSSDPKAFTETMRIKGNGNLTVGDRVNVLGRPGDTGSITKNAVITTGTDWQLQDPGKNAFTLELRDSGVLDLFGTKTKGKVDWVRMAHFDAPNNTIEFPSSAPFIVRGKLYAGDGFVYYWGPDKKWYGIEHGRGGPLSSTDKAVAAPSDLRLKKDVQTIPSALEKIDRLRGVTFHWNEQGLQYLTRDIETMVSAGPGTSDEENRKVWREKRDQDYKELAPTSVGVLAQDVESVLPEAVTTDETGYKSVKYYQLIPLMIEALKEENKISREQTQTIARQQNEIERLTAVAHATEAELAELSDVRHQLNSLVTTVNKIRATDQSLPSADLLQADRQPAGSQ